MRTNNWLNATPHSDHVLSCKCVVSGLFIALDSVSALLFASIIGVKSFGSLLKATRRPSPVARRRGPRCTCTAAPRTSAGPAAARSGLHRHPAGLGELRLALFGRWVGRGAGHRVREAHLWRPRLRTPPHAPLHAVHRDSGNRCSACVIDIQAVSAAGAQR